MARSRTPKSRATRPRSAGTRLSARSGRLVAIAAARVVASIASLAAGPVFAQVAVPFGQSGISLGSPSSEVTYTVDLATLPERPRMTATVVPGASHPNLSLQVEISGCTLGNGGFGASCPAVTLSPAGTGPRSVSYEPWRCVVGTTVPAYVGKTCNVKVRTLDFGPAGPPASFDLSISAVSVVPTSTLTRSVTTNPVQTLVLEPTRDTTIYESSTASSNGAGESFWARESTAGSRLRALLDFDVAGALPAGAVVVDARIELTTLKGSVDQTIQLHAIPSFVTAWVEGVADAVGDESAPPAAANTAATWSHRRWFSLLPQGAWSSPGGDYVARPLADALIPSTPSRLVLSSDELRDHVISMQTSSAGHDGLLLRMKNSGSARFASREDPNASVRPLLVVDYTIPPALSGSLSTGGATFFNEAQDFRWIYDLDQDNILMTPVQGRCEILQTIGPSLPYDYQFLGNPGFSGVDCCTWQIESVTGIQGSGQALFYVNLDASNPANQPPDSDLDGIKNLCDNCPSVPNGPLLGSCISGSRPGALCRSNHDCSGGLCSFAQGDLDRNRVGDACVPEPGLAIGLGCGLLALAAVGSRRKSGERV